MKRVWLMVAFSLIAQVLAAQQVDLASLTGENWYGVYLSGQKAGYASSGMKIDDKGRVVIYEDSRFQVTMHGVRQDMRIISNRTYDPAGPLLEIDMRIQDPAGPTTFNCIVNDHEMIFRSTIGRETREARLPKPQESLKDALRQYHMTREGAQVGDEVAFHVFEPTYNREIEGVARIVGIEQRIFDGAATRVYKIKETLSPLGVESLSYVTEHGLKLEDHVATLITLRLEQEALAKDVNYSNDVIVSNAAYIDAPIDEPRTRDHLKLVLRGPLKEDHLFNDERQYLHPDGDRFLFTASKISLDGFIPAYLPIINPEVTEWLKPTMFVQSDNPKIIRKAKQIVGEEENALKISEKLCEWVYHNVHTTFSARLTNALEVLENLKGDCTEHSILFIALARAAGVPAREVAGLIYVEGERPGFYFHQWATVWVGKWIDVDPTFNQPLADVTHIKLAEGDLLNQAKLIPIIGQIAIETVPEKDAQAATTVGATGSG
jgi:hypothetical protein